MIKLFSAVLRITLFLFGLAFMAQAQDVVLTSRDGSIEISGTLLGFNGEFYRVETVYGELTVDGSGVSCDGPGCPSLIDYIAKVRVSGSASLGEVLVPALIEAFAAKNQLSAILRLESEHRFVYLLRDAVTGKPRAGFQFHLSTAEEGFADLIADKAEFVLSTRQMRPVEQPRIEENQPKDLLPYSREYVLALDALVPVTMPGHPVRRISLSALAAVFSGEISNWKDLGGPEAPIIPYLRDPRSGVAQAVTDRVLRPAGQVMSSGLTRVAGNEDLDLRVSRDSLALGLLNYSSIRFAQPMQIAGECGFALRATPRMIKTEDYPLTTPVFMYMLMRRLPKIARQFLAYTSTASAQAVIRRAGFIDQDLEDIPINQQGDRLVQAVAVAGDGTTLQNLQTMLGMLSSLDRMTMSFRFVSGSSQLDAQSRANVKRLAVVLEGDDYDGRTLAFVGFSDGLGALSQNLELAQTRAEMVRDAVLQAAEAVNIDRLDITAAAFGEAMPIACDLTDWGRDINRRVEVWTR